MHISSNQYSSNIARTRDLDNGTISARSIDTIVVGDVLNLDGSGCIHRIAPNVGTIVVGDVLDLDGNGYIHRIAPNLDTIVVADVLDVD